MGQYANKKILPTPQRSFLRRCIKFNMMDGTQAWWRKIIPAAFTNAQNVSLRYIPRGTSQIHAGRRGAVIKGLYNQLDV